MMLRDHPILPFAAAIIGIAAYSLMDAVLKSAAIATGVFTAILLRNIFGTALMLPVWLLSRRPSPSRAALRVHFLRSAVVAVMALLFFYGLVRIPLAEAIAISFIAPLIALYFAALVLGEVIRPKAIAASLMGLAGVIVIGAARFGRGEFDADSAQGIAAILISAVLFAFNLVLQRKQALLAGPVEIALAQNVLVAAFLALGAPWFFHWPQLETLREIVLGAALSIAAVLFLSWGYARAEAQALIPVEYTGFLWAALFGWMWFGERVGPATVAGAVLIVIGCWIAARKPTEITAL